MKAIKTYLENFKEVVTAQWVAELQKETPNLALTAHWNNMMVAVEEQLRMLNNETKA